ncbi:MAG: hypothetical protein JSV52_13820 [Candidatus Zixiibacteriota bacterium]|nr:MAG: hypothetical protein JSV52_13820 [candidate division Zixibacteria bacterium]
MGYTEWPNRLSCALARFIDQNEMNEILDGCDRLPEMNEKDKAQWVTQAIAKLDRHVPEQQDRIEIMTECSCRCWTDIIDELKAEYKRTGDIDELINIMHGRVFINRPQRQDNIVYITKVPRFPEEHARAVTREEKKYYYCHCDYARAANGNLSSTYCLCGAGWCKTIWEQILGRPIQVDVLESVLLGGEVCKFAVYL